MMMKQIKKLSFFLSLLLGFGSLISWTAEKQSNFSLYNKFEENPSPLKIGYSVGLGAVNSDKMKYAKSVGIDYIEVSGMNGFFNTDHDFIKNHEDAERAITSAKNATDEAGIKVWSIHMAFSKHMDLSTIDEEERKNVVEGHKKLLSYLKILKPKVILFHPSFYLDPTNEREERKDQLIKSAIELDKAVRAIGATMVIENMLGPELMVGKRERPLMRTVEETTGIFDRLPLTIYAAIDMNHIKNPERLIKAMGNRMKSVHIADGTGEAENHWLPCSGKGSNDWIKILSALNDIKYKGPFIFESKYNDEQELVNCYQELYSNFIESRK